MRIRPSFVLLFTVLLSGVLQSAASKAESTNVSATRESPAVESGSQTRLRLILGAAYSQIDTSDSSNSLSHKLGTAAGVGMELPVTGNFFHCNRSFSSPKPGLRSTACPPASRPMSR